MDVFITQGQQEKVVVEIDENLFPLVKVENRSNQLTIGIKDCQNLTNVTEFNVYITIKDLKSIHFAGVGDLKSKETLSLTDLTLKNTGVGDIALVLDVSHLNVLKQGVGDIKLEGVSDHLEIKNTGVGDVKAKSFMSKRVNLNHSGVGDVEVYAAESIDIISSGVGDVKYYGTAEKVGINSTGIGQIKKK